MLENNLEVNIIPTQTIQLTTGNVIEENMKSEFIKPSSFMILNPIIPKEDGIDNSNTKNKSQNINKNRSGQLGIVVNSPANFNIQNQIAMNNTNLITDTTNTKSHERMHQFTPNAFTRQVSLNHTMKGNKNLNIVILERNSPSKNKRRLTRTRKNPIFGADLEIHNEDDSNNELKASFTIREEFHQEENEYLANLGNLNTPNTPIVSKAIFRSRSPLGVNNNFPKSKSNVFGSNLNQFDKRSVSFSDNEGDSKILVSAMDSGLIYQRKANRQRTQKTHKSQRTQKDNFAYELNFGENTSNNNDPRNLSRTKSKIENVEKDQPNISENTSNNEGIGLKNKEEGEENDNFNFGIQQDRRYKRKDISTARNYFKYRYISEKLIEINNLADQKGERRDKDNIKDSSPNPVVYSADDKNVIKFTCIFLQKIEKSIFLFNMKKYEDSFNYLKESNIMKNESEFGEILLIFPGFDKFIIGEFLAKEKKPNENFAITKLFINHMDFRDERFLDSFRFLLSRMNLPIDSSLILNIIDVFSTVYFNDNKDHQKFKDTTSVYLMASTILALNTMFHRKIPNAQIRPIKKEDFVKMNNTVDTTVAEEIYEELRYKKLDIIYDYNEQIYKKMELKAEDLLKTSKKDMLGSNLGNNAIRSDGVELTNNGRVDVVNGEELINMLKLGEVFVKYGTSGDPHERFIYLSSDEQKLLWRPMNCTCFSRERSIKTISLNNIYIGASNSQIFEKYKISPEYELNCFSILAGKRSLDLKHDDQKVCKKWYQAIRYLIKRIKSISEVKNKKLKAQTNRKEIISDYWRTEILPNWGEYRKFLLIKGNSNCQNQFFSNNEIYKKNIKNILKSEKKTSKIVIEEKDKQDVAYLWFLGIPVWLRKKMWSLVIANDINFNENLFNFFLRNIECIEFHGDTAIDRKKMTDLTPGGYDDNNVVGDFDGIPIIEENKMIETKYEAIDNPLVSEIIMDIHKCYKKFEEYIKNDNREEKRFKEDLFKILRVFTNYRPDVTYSRQIAYIATVFYLNSDDFFQAFILTINFIIPSYLTKFLVRDEIFIKTRCQFFEDLLKSHTPAVYKHLKNLDISIRLFFYDWVEFLYTKTFKYETILRIWDCYLAKGEIFIYEVALSIIKLQEKDLVNSTVKGVLSSLSCFPEKYTEDDLFEVIEKIDINNEYSTMNEHDELAQEKSQLYSAFLYY